MKKQLESLEAILKKLRIPVELSSINIGKKQRTKKPEYIYACFFKLAPPIKERVLHAHKEHNPLGNYETGTVWVAEGRGSMMARGPSIEVPHKILVKFEPETSYDQDKDLFYKRFEQGNDQDFIQQAAQYFIELNRKVRK